jgi:xylulose-5-phosphate/fructose-6-phosphate phosphoketolase
MARAVNMVMLNDLDRYHLVMDVIDRVPAPPLWQRMADARLPARAWTREHGADIAEVAQWTWPG